MINRRTFLYSSGRTALGAFALSTLNTINTRAAAKINKIGLQLYTLRKEMETDFEGSLQKAAAIGYNEVEFAGYYKRTPEQVKEILSRFGLTSPSVHVPLTDIQMKLNDSIEAAKVIGHKLIVCPFLNPQDRKSLDDYKRHAETFNKAAAACKKAGIEFAYHNHNFEFDAIDGKLPFDLLLAETDKNLVKFEMDLYWIRKAKQDALAYINKNPGRFVAFHVKDMDKTPQESFTEVGRGVIDFKQIFAQRNKAGVKYFIVEQDQCPGSPFDSIK
ncbi:MAG: sugar phosphate isomerase/epimerase, partial [Blastocatellia bacterium]|nr:sugar phosphate isomerase/epimerase [Blastocatellia bacterium]